MDADYSLARNGFRYKGVGIFMTEEVNAQINKKNEEEREKQRMEIPPIVKQRINGMVCKSYLCKNVATQLIEESIHNYTLAYNDQILNVGQLIAFVDKVDEAYIALERAGRLAENKK